VSTYRSSVTPGKEKSQPTNESYIYGHLAITFLIETHLIGSNAQIRELSEFQILL
jgi:hypothetical protein